MMRILCSASPAALAAALVLVAGCSSSKQTTGEEKSTGDPMSGGVQQSTGAIRLNVPNPPPPPPPPFADPTAERLDNLAALSNGDYIHVEVSRCFGRCEATVSLFRESPAKFHIYEAEAYRYDEFERGDILYRVRRPIASDSANDIFRAAETAGIMTLTNDTTMLMTDQPYLWVRARIGGRTVSVNHAYVGGRKYASEGTRSSLYDAYSKVRTLLLAPLFAGPKSEGTAPR